MAVALKDRPVLNFVAPPGVTMASWDSGSGTVTDAFKPDQEPGVVAADGRRAVGDRRPVGWFDRRHRRRGGGQPAQRRGRQPAWADCIEPRRLLNVSRTCPPNPTP